MHDIELVVQFEPPRLSRANELSLPKKTLIDTKPVLVPRPLRRLLVPHIPDLITLQANPPLTLIRIINLLSKVDILL